jgi:biopolymer transport protein ExbD
MPSIPERNPAIVSIADASRIQLDGTSTTLEQLRPLIQSRVAHVPELEVTLLSEPSVPYARVIEVMDALRSAGVDHISFAGSGGVTGAH